MRSPLLNFGSSRAVSDGWLWDFTIGSGTEVDELHPFHCGECDDSVREESFAEISAGSRPSEFEACRCAEPLENFVEVGLAKVNRKLVNLIDYKYQRRYS